MCIVNKSEDFQLDVTSSFLGMFNFCQMKKCSLHLSLGACWPFYLEIIVFMPSVNISLFLLNINVNIYNLHLTNNQRNIPSAKIRLWGELPKVL